MIQELHRRHVRAGESFGNAYVIGWFDDVGEMQRVYDRFQGATRLTLEKNLFRLEK
jgi:hypothetical protein